MSEESDRIADAYAKNRGKYRLLNAYIPAAAPFGLVLFLWIPIGAFGVIALMFVVYIWLAKLSTRARTIEGEHQLKPISRLWVTATGLLILAAITMFVLQALNG